MLTQAANHLLDLLSFRWSFTFPTVSGEEDIGVQCMSVLYGPEWMGETGWVDKSAVGIGYVCMAYIRT